ncbi:O-antigen translocase [Marinomonas sp. A79]|uniref:O-antigen translocase n=1 Tax=Marinomonas vulgaris TaxID=2823372 RepID=A0ABS5HCW6_9GAMM|nr:O-antigen translocase [Marinomonas vulgaris]MBR7889322.1 O-antigen translocase [Marinomonas vulgaris]
MNLLKTSMLTGISTLIRIFSGFIITKIIAVYGGPTGVALIGQLQSVINITMLAAGDFLKTATTKYTAEYNEDDKAKHKIWSAAFKTIVSLSLINFFVYFFFSEKLSFYFLGSSDYSYIFKVFSVSLPFFVFNSFLMAIINGKKKIKEYIVLNIVSSLISLSLVSIFSYRFGLDGALLSYVTNQSLVFFIALIWIYKQVWFKFEYFAQKTDLQQYKGLLGFAIITFCSIMASNASIFYIRSYLIDNLSSTSAGNWQAMWSLSQFSLTLITTSLSTYLLPTLSRLKCKDLMKKELNSAIKIIIPIVIVISTGMYLFRDFIITLLYTAEFSEMRGLFFWQMVGNCLKVFGWLFGYVLVAKGMVKYTVATEIIFSLNLCVLSTYLISMFGLIGAVYAYTINSAVHAIAMIFLFKFKVN